MCFYSLMITLFNWSFRSDNQEREAKAYLCAYGVVIMAGIILSAIFSIKTYCDKIWLN